MHGNIVLTILTARWIWNICKINEFVSRNESLQWGALRTGTVGVGDFVPSIPVKEKVMEELSKIAEINDCIERAVEYFAYVCKQQLFGDGNKRTSTIVASKILIESGNGILTIEKDNAEEFNSTLHNWYLKDELRPLKNCLKKCIKTLNQGRRIHLTQENIEKLYLLSVKDAGFCDGIQ